MFSTFILSFPGDPVPKPKTGAAGEVVGIADVNENTGIADELKGEDELSDAEDEFPNKDPVLGDSEEEPVVKPKTDDVNGCELELNRLVAAAGTTEDVVSGLEETVEVSLAEGPNTNGDVPKPDEGLDSPSAEDEENEPNWLELSPN